MLKLHKFLSFLLLMVIIGCAHHEEGARTISYRHAEAIEEPQWAESMNLEQCVDMALKNNRRCPASKLMLEVAEAQHQQVMSYYWPQVTFNASYMLMDKDPNMLVPSSTLHVPASSLSIPGFPPIPVAARDLAVPETDIKLSDKAIGNMNVGAQYLLFDGWKRRYLGEQTAQGMEIAKHEMRRTDLEVAYDTRRMFYGNVLAKKLYSIAHETLLRMQATLTLTEQMYNEGVGDTKRTDYLRTKTSVEVLESIVALLKHNEALSRSALANVMGLPWYAEIEVSEEEIPFYPFSGDLNQLVDTTYRFSPDWGKVLSAVKAAEAKVEEEKSDNFPKVVLQGGYNHIINSYDYGVVSDNNKKVWSVGVGMSLPIFSGFLVSNKVKEAKARLAYFQEQKALLEEEVGVKVKGVVLKIQTAQEQYKALDKARETARENRSLNERAYREGFVETRDVVAAQLMEGFVAAQYHKALFDNMEEIALLDRVLGEEIYKLL